MISFIIVTFVLSTTFAQRPFYVPLPVERATLASRFRTDDDLSSTPSTLGNRLGENDGTIEKLPVDARGDEDLVHRLNQWPRENRPFWLINSEAIEAHRNPQGNSQPSRSSSQSNSRDNFDVAQFTQNRFQYDSNEIYDDFGNVVKARTIRPVQTRAFFAGPL